MVGITSYGFYIPLYRLGRDEIARSWGTVSMGGEKAICNFDEDIITMAVAAARDCLKGKEIGKVDGLFLATTTSPYKEKLGASIVAAALDLPPFIRTADFTNSLRSGTIAMNSAIDSVGSGAAENIIVIAVDSRLGVAQSNLEQIVGDGAAALIIGNSGVIASIDGRYSLSNPTIDLWKDEKDSFTRSWEERFVMEEYQMVMKDSISGLLGKHNISLKDFSKAVLYSPDGRNHVPLARILGLDSKRVQDPLFTKIGNIGNASTMVMLAGSFEDSEPGEKILLANYGDGTDCFILGITDEMKKGRQRRSIKDQLNFRKEISYVKYLKWRQLLEFGEPRRPALPVPSITCLWREQKKNLSFYGSRCKKCGTIQYPPQRVCTGCQAKDNFEDYKFSDKVGKVFTFSVDYLARSLDPPTVFPIVDFEGGGRMSCTMTDCEPTEIAIGVDVEMSFRKLYEAGCIHNYYWKVKPLIKE